VFLVYLNSELCFSVRCPTEERSSDGDIVSRDREQLRKDTLSRPTFSLCHDWRRMTVATNWIGATLNRDVGTVHA
jgi:hypothetical protein